MLYLVYIFAHIACCKLLFGFFSMEGFTEF